MKVELLFVFFLSGSLVLPPAAMPQTALPDSSFVQEATARLTQIYTAATADNLHLYNGSEYLRAGHGVQGFPFFASADMISGEVAYDGRLYTGVPMQYDVVEDNLIIRDYTGNVSIRLIKEKLRYFIIGSHRFVHLRGGEGLPAAGFYESLYSGGLRAWARRRKSVLETTDHSQRYQSYDEWLLEKGGIFYPVEGERAVLALLGDKKEALKKYTRSARLSFKKDPAGFLAGVTAYYDQLNH